MAWHGSNRRSRLPTDWNKRKARTWKRDRGVCQWPSDVPPGDLAAITIPQGAAICAHPGADVDHKTPGDDHSDTNLWVLCHWHHQRKTIAERARPAPRRRPPERHPGILPG